MGMASPATAVLGVGTPAMGGNLATSLNWGGQQALLAASGLGAAEAEEPRTPSSKRRGFQPKTRPRRSNGDAFNSKASHFAHLTPWNKIEMLNEVCPENFGMLYCSEASLDELDSAILIATGKTPNDRILFREKSSQFQAARIRS